MKHMTADLIAEFRSKDDQIAEAASAKWDQACAEYREHVKTIRSQLPRALRWIVRNYLHDAKVHTLAVDKHPFVSIFLQREGSPDDIFEMRYRLAEDGFKLVRHPELEGDGKPFQWWLYDEVDVAEARTGVGQEGPVFSHHILLTGGWELQLVFRELRIARLKVFLSPASSITEEQIERLALC